MRTKASRAGVIMGMAAALALTAIACVERTPSRGRKRKMRKLTAADKAIIEKNILKAPPEKMSHPVNAKLENKVIYLGLDVQGQVKLGKPVRLVHYWKVLQAMPGWRMFTHMNGPGGKTSFINVDHIAVGGRYPMGKWKPGEIIRDAHTVTVPANWAHSSVEIYTGVWRPQAGRLKVKSGPHDGSHRVRAATIHLKRGAGARPSKLAEAPKTYTVRKAKGPIKMDGKADEEDWKNAPSTGAFVNSMTGGKVPLATEAKLLWDDKNLYVLFQCKDADVWSGIKKHDGALWTQEAVEMMIDADGDGATYIELQVSPNGTTFDAYLPRHRQAQMDWESGMKAAVKVNGTLNKRDDTDQGWTVELALPLSAVRGRSDKKTPAIPPKLGDQWRANLFRMEVPKGKARQASAWSPPLKGDFHTLNRFGALIFADASGSTADKARPAPARPDARKAKEPRPRGRKAGKTARKARKPRVRPATGPRKAR